MVEGLVDIVTGVVIEEMDDVISLCAHADIKEAVIPRSPIKVIILDFPIFKYDK